MKVICIDAVPRDIPHKLLDEGKIYTARQSDTYPSAYQLAELPYNPYNGTRIHFGKRRFVPLSSIDETEFERNYNKELV